MLSEAHVKAFGGAIAIPSCLSRDASPGALFSARAAQNLSVGHTRCLSRLQAEEVGWGERLEVDIDLDPPSMRQAIAWSFALRNIRRAETEEAGERLLKSSGADSVRDVKARLACT